MSSRTAEVRRVLHAGTRADYEEHVCIGLELADGSVTQIYLTDADALRLIDVVQNAIDLRASSNYYDEPTFQ